jgi:hypothetical protein
MTTTTCLWGLLFRERGLNPPETHVDPFVRLMAPEDQSRRTLLHIRSTGWDAIFFPVATFGSWMRICK